MLVVRGAPPSAVRRPAHRLARARLRCASSSSTGCCRSRGSAAARRTRASSTPRATTCCRSARTSSAAGSQLTDAERARLCRTVLATAAFVAAFGLIDVYVVPLSWWRPARPAGSSDQLGLDYSAGVRAAGELRLQRGQRRRLPAAHLDVPLAARDRLPARRRAVLHPAAAPLGAAARRCCSSRRSSGRTRARRCSRSSPVLVLRRDRAPAPRRARLASRSSSPCVGFAFVKGYDHFGPRTHFTATELQVQEQNAKQHPRDVERRDERERVVDERASRVAARRRAHGRCTIRGASGSATPASPRRARTSQVEAGESTYTELGVETGLLGGLVFVAWSLALLARRAAPAPVARRGLRGGARARPPDRRDRRAVDRGRRVGARRRATSALTLQQLRAGRRTDTCGALAAVRTVDGVRLSLVELGLLVGAAAVVVDGAAALLGQRSGDRAVVRASWARTPGVLNPDVTQATIRATICTPRLDAHRSAAGLVHERAEGAAARAVRPARPALRASRRTT